VKATRGWSDGKTLELEEPINLDRRVEVIVLFPDLPDIPLAPGLAPDRLVPRVKGPEGLPPLPTPEEWKQRMTEVVRMMSEWEREDESDDLATWEELKAGLDARPFTLREVELND